MDTVKEGIFQNKNKRNFSLVLTIGRKTELVLKWKLLFLHVNYSLDHYCLVVLRKMVLKFAQILFVGGGQSSALFLFWFDSFKYLEVRSLESKYRRSMQLLPLIEVTSDGWFRGEGVYPFRQKRRFPVTWSAPGNKGVGHLCSLSGLGDGQ